MASIIDAAVAKIKPRGYPSKVVAAKHCAGTCPAQGDETLKDVHVLIPRPAMKLIVDGIDEQFTAHHLWEAGDREAWFREFGPKVRGIGAVIPTKSNQPRRRGFDREAYRARNRVERLFNRLKQFRRIATRYEKRAANYLAMVNIGMIMLWL